MDVTANDVISKYLEIGMFVSINQRLDAETINIIAEEFGYKVESTLAIPEEIYGALISQALLCRKLVKISGNSPK